MFRSLFNDLPLLTDAHVLQIVETEANFGIKMRGELSSGVHVVPQLIVVPENLVLLVQRGDHAVVFSRLLESGEIASPTWLEVNLLVLVKLQKLVLKCYST